MIDGTWYLALIPDALATCTNDHFNRDRLDPAWIDEDTMMERVRSRRAYQLRRHGARDSEGFQRYALPDPEGYIAFDPLMGELLPKPTAKTVTIPMSVGERWGQKYPYLDEEWQAGYNLRSGVERKNRELKHENYIDLESADRRPQRGLAANAVAVAMYITSANIKTLDNFLRTAEGIDTTKSPRRRKSRRDDTLRIASVAKQRDGRTTAARPRRAA
jgi:hypothetical protein